MTELTPQRSTPLVCRREAFEFMAAQVPRLETDPAALLRGAVAISMHELVDADPEAVEGRIRALAVHIRTRSGGASPRGLLARAHEVLFDELGFEGNREQYFDPRNCYVGSALDRQKGLPVTLCLIYKAVLEEVGLPVQGVNAPGHFLARVEMDGQPTLVDPFFGGRPLELGEAVEHIERVSSVRPPAERLTGTAATPRQWLSRILSNLEHIFYQTQQREQLLAMLELRRLLTR